MKRFFYLALALFAVAELSAQRVAVFHFDVQMESLMPDADVVVKKMNQQLLLEGCEIVGYNEILTAISQKEYPQGRLSLDQIVDVSRQINAEISIVGELVNDIRGCHINVRAVDVKAKKVVLQLNTTLKVDDSMRSTACDIASRIYDEVIAKNKDNQTNTKVDFAEFAKDIEIIQQVTVEEEFVEDDQSFVRVEQMPSFMGGDLMTFRNWVTQNIRYPQKAQENKIVGRVLVEFVIERDGSLTNIKPLLSPDQVLTDEAVRVLKSSPKWTPGMQRNQTVRVKYTMPIEFRLGN